MQQVGSHIFILDHIVSDLECRSKADVASRLKIEINKHSHIFLFPFPIIPSTKYPVLTISGTCMFHVHEQQKWIVVLHTSEFRIQSIKSEMEYFTA